MTDIWITILQYAGTGYLLILYFISLILMFLREDDRGNRAIFLYLPLIFLALFVFPPFRNLYGRFDSTATYYRFLWLLPMSTTIGYTAVKQFSTWLKPGILIAGLLVVMCGKYTYENVNILPAENRLHLPQMAIDVTDFIMNESGGDYTIVSMPPGLVQFVRQYESKLWLPYGREMLLPDFRNYHHAVYEAYIEEELDPDALIGATRQYNCNYVVVEAVRVKEEDMERLGMELLANVDGYNIYYDPQSPDWSSMGG